LRNRKTNEPYVLRDEKPSDEISDDFADVDASTLQPFNPST
jgi:hypothetical protein